MATKKTAKRPSAKQTNRKPKELEYVIVRTHIAGVHCGYLEHASASDDRIVLLEARRIWYWDGAASISEIAVHGLNPKRAAGSKIAEVVPRQNLRWSDHGEIIALSPTAAKQIQEFPVWRT